MVQHRVEQFFPDTNLNEIDENVLLSTIRVPKNLLYLTERLPKPNYYSTDEDSMQNRHTTANGYLPEIRQNYKSLPPKMKKRKVKKSPVREPPSLGILKLHKIDSPVGVKNPDEDEYEEEYNKMGPPPAPAKSDHTASLPPSIKPAAAVANIEQMPDLTNSADKRKIKHKGDSSKSKESSLSASKEHKSVMHDRPDGGSSILKSLVKETELDSERLIEKPEKPKEELKPGIMIPARHKRYKRKPKQSGESLSPSYHQQDYSPYKQEQYIQQVLNRKSPIARPINHNLQMLADIYAGKSPQLSLIAKKLQCIKPLRVLLKRGDYNLPVYIPPGGKELPKLKLEPIKPIKLLNYAKDAQVLGQKMAVPASGLNLPAQAQSQSPAIQHPQMH